MPKSYLRIIMAAALLVCSSMSTTAFAQSAGISNILSQASDNALDKLAQPGAFYADKAVRILLPGPLEKAGKLLRLTGKSGLTKDLTKNINDAASLAATEAKPVFRTYLQHIRCPYCSRCVVPFFWNIALANDSSFSNEF